MIDLLVIGGGITGSYIAYLAALQGYAATLITGNDQSTASCNNPGGINPLHGPGIPGIMEEFSMQSYHLHLANWQKINKFSGIDFNGRMIERLFIAFNNSQQEELEEFRKLYCKHEGFSAKWLEPAEIAEKNPRLSKNILGGLYTRGNVTVDPGKYTFATLSAAAKMGTVIVRDDVARLDRIRGGYEALCVSGQTFKTQKLVLAAGARTEELLKHLDIEIPLKPVKGELLLIETGNEHFAFDVTCGKDGLYHYNANLYWLGGTREDVGFDNRISEKSAGVILDTVSELLPEISNYVVKRHVAAFRPTTPDGLPIVGCFQSEPHLFVATGAGSKGMLWSSRMAEVIVEQLCGNVDEILEILAPERFFANWP